jgi:hypothetical protein
VADPQISTVLIPCLVLQRNNTTFKTGENVVGQINMVPCRNVDIKEIPFWMVPVKDSGIFTTLEPILAAAPNANQPTYDSVLATRIVDKQNEVTWHVYTPGGYTDFINACATCCSSPPIPMPGTVDGFSLAIIPYQTLCEVMNANGQFVTYFGIPSLAPGQNYFPAGAYNNKLFTAAPLGGFSTIAAMLTFMNANYNPGSPPIVWTATTDGLTIVATGGNLKDELGVTITATPTSP